MKFKNLKAGLFRKLNGVTYVKLAEPDEKQNAVMIVSGEGEKIEDEEEVMEW